MSSLRRRIATFFESAGSTSGVAAPNVRGTGVRGGVYSAAGVATVGGGGAFTVAPDDLPEGNGLAAAYPGDSGITANSAVIFADDFESYTANSQLTSSGNWNGYYQSGNILLDTGTVFDGTRSIRLRMPQTGSEVSNAIIKTISPDQDQLFVRVYTRYAANYTGMNSAHNGIRVTANYTGPGSIPSGTNFMLCNLETAGFSGAAPGSWHLYVYHPEQDDNYGETWYPSGRTTNGAGPDGGFGSNFVARPEIVPARGEWICVELMVKLNTPGQRDGRVAAWQNGVLFGDWQNIRFRDSTAVKLDEVQFENGGQGSTQVNDKWYDNVVVATQYIGPRVAPPPSGGVVNADSPSQADVAAAIAAANVGDTVQVPAGSGTWNTLSVNKAVRIVGAGIGLTNITLGSGNTITKQSAGVTRIRGFTFSKSGGGTPTSAIDVVGSWSARPVIFEECRFNVSGSGLFHPNVSGGVIWAKCSFYGGWDDSFIAPKLVSQANSLAEWQTASTFGTSDPGGERNFYVEDCYFRGGTNQGVDWDYNARVVFRGNRCDYFCFNSHGLATGPVGMRHFEIYNNKFWNTSAGGWLGFTDFTQDISAMNQAIWIRGGTGVIYNNEIDDIANNYWGFSKAEGKFDIRAQQDGSGSSYGINPPPVAWTSAGQGNYPRQHQLAVSWDGRPTNSGYFIDPIYIWGNTGAGTNAQGGLKDFQNGGSWGSQTGYFNEGRDYFNGGSAKPGYTPYTYPHPLRETTGQAY